MKFIPLYAIYSTYLLFIFYLHILLTHNFRNYFEIQFVNVRVSWIKTSSDKLWTHDMCIRFSIAAAASGRGQSAECSSQRQHLFRGRVGNEAWQVWCMCGAWHGRGTWRDSSLATVNLHEFIEHRIEREREGERETGSGRKGGGWGAETLLERNATHFPEEKRQLLFAICARWLYFWSFDTRFSISIAISIFICNYHSLH